MGPCATISVGAGIHEPEEWRSSSSSFGAEMLVERLLLLWPVFASARAQARHKRRTMSMARSSHNSLGGRRYSLTLPRSGSDVTFPVLPRSFGIIVVLAVVVVVGSAVVVVSV
jgi:hypothetical protein